MKGSSIMTHYRDVDFESIELFGNSVHCISLEAGLAAAHFNSIFSTFVIFEACIAWTLHKTKSFENNWSQQFDSNTRITYFIRI